MAVIITPKRRPWEAIPGLPAITRALTWVRQYPLIPLAVLVFLLIIPAIFADQIAPHDHLIGDLNNSLVPPAWVGERITVRTVVEHLDRRTSERIALSAAQRR